MNKTQISAEIVADSIDTRGNRLTSFLITMPRIILSEINTHRMLSKNTSSSRAIPFNKMVESVKNDPFIPIAWQKAHSGMQGSNYITNLDNLEQCEIDWLNARDYAIRFASRLDKGFEDFKTDNTNVIPPRIDCVTKQLCNRLLEPFMWTTMLITGSKEGWDNFFELRCPQYHYDLEDKHFKSKKEWLDYYRTNCIGDPNSNFELDEMEWFSINKGQAEIHIMGLSEKIYDAIQESTPKRIEEHEWHVPLIEVIED